MAGIFRPNRNAPDRFPDKLFIPDNIFRSERTVRKTSHMGLVQPTPTVPNYSIELGQWFSWALNNNVIVWDTTPYVTKNIYTDDDSIQTNRTVTHDGKFLWFNTEDDLNAWWKVGSSSTQIYLESNVGGGEVHLGDFDNVTNGIGVGIDVPSQQVFLGDYNDSFSTGFEINASNNYNIGHGNMQWDDYGTGVKTDVNLGKVQSTYAPIFATDGTLLEVDITTIAGDPDQNVYTNVIGDVGSYAAASTTDFLNIVGGTSITTTITPNTITITNDDPNQLHTGEVESTSPSALIAHESIISNKTAVTPVTGDYLLLWDATDNSLKKIDYSNVLSVTPNLWATFTGDAGSTTANTTADVFNIVGGAGIATAIVGDTITITNTGAGAVTTASNALQKVANDIQLGNTASGTGAADMTRNSYIYMNTFDLFFESPTENIMHIDVSGHSVTVGDTVAGTTQAILRVYESGATPTFYYGGGQLMVQHSNTTGDDAGIVMVSGDTGTNFIAFQNESGSDLGVFQYSNAFNGFEWIYDGATKAVFDGGQWQWNDYGLGSFTGTATYYLAVDASGNVIEEPIPGGGGVDTGIYVGSGTVPTSVVATLTDSLWWRWTGTQFINFDDAVPSQYLYSRYDNNGFTGWLLRNADPGTSAHFRLTLQTEDGGGDPFMYFSINGSTNWSLGIDNSDSDTFKLINNFSMTSGARLEMTTAGALQLNSYGVGTFTGTPAYYLLVDATGNVIEVPYAAGSLQNIWYTIVADTGSTVASTPTDALEILGGTDISTTIVGDTLTIDYIGAGGSDTTIYDTDGSITATETRTLSGTAAETLIFNFVQGATSSTQQWDYDELLRDVTVSGGDSMSEIFNDNIYTRTASNSAGTQTTFINHTDSLMQISKTHDTLYNHDLSFFAGSAFLRIENLVTAYDTRVELNNGTSVEMITESSGNTGRISVVNSGTVSEIRLNTKGISDATVAAGYVFTLVDVADGYGEWQPGASSQNLWETITSDSGSTLASSPVDTLTITGTGGITTSITGDTITIDGSGVAGADTNIYDDSGVLSANRNVDLDIYGLTIDGLTSSNLYTKWDETANRWITYSLQGSQYLAVKVGTGQTAQIGAWSSSVDSTTSNHLEADSDGVGLYRRVATADNEYIKIFDTGASPNNGYIGIHSENSGYDGDILIDGPEINLTTTTVGSGYSDVHLEGGGLVNQLTLTVTDGSGNTNQLSMNDVETSSSSAWSDTGIKTDGTARNVDHHNYNPGDLDKTRIIRYNSTGFHYLTGMLASHAQDGFIVEIWNIGTVAFNLEYESASSSPANRFILPGMVDYRVNEGGAVILRYDAISSRWRLIAGS